MGCVVLHAATANAATIASSSGRFIILSNGIEFLIVVPLTDEDCALVAFLGNEIVYARVRFSLTNYATYPNGSVRQRP